MTVGVCDERRGEWHDVRSAVSNHGVEGQAGTWEIPPVGRDDSRFCLGDITGSKQDSAK